MDSPHASATAPVEHEQEHAHAPGRAHHFASAEDQREAATLGMWIFLVTEIMFFGGLLLVYTVYRGLHPAGFAAASAMLDVRLGAINTAILITSGFFMALAVHAAETGRRRALVLFLTVTMVFGAGFVGIKALEYWHKFHEHLIPGRHFHFEGPEAATAQMFFALYFATTGLHLLHMVIGFGLLTWLLAGAARGRYGPAYATPVMNVGLYWHFVDIVWIFLFPLLYLVGKR